MYPLISIGPLVVPTYILLISLLYCFLIFWIVKRAERTLLDRVLALDFALTVMIGGFLGARLFHVAFENPEHYINHPLNFFKIWEGGFVFYGGALGAFVLFYLMARKKNVSPMLWLDFYTPVLAMGYGLGRMGCFLAGCCYGGYCELPWGVQFPHLDGLRHPTQLYALLWEMMICLFLFTIERRRRSQKQTLHPLTLRTGNLFFIWILLHSLGRIIMEIFRADHRGPTILSLSISTILSLLFIITSVSVLARSSKSSQ